MGNCAGDGDRERANGSQRPPSLWIADQVLDNVRERAMAPVAKVARVIVFMNIVNTTVFAAQIFVMAF